MSSGADVSLTTPNFSLNGGPLAADLNGDGADDLLLSAANQSAPGGARSLAGQADIVFGDPPPAVFSLGIGAMQYRVEAPGAGAGGFFVAPGASLPATPEGLDGAMLSMEITSGYEASADRFLIGSNAALAGDGFASSAATGANLVLLHRGVPFGAASTTSNAFRASFNAQATPAAVEALLGHVRYENGEFSEAWFQDADQVYPSRTLRLQLRAPGVPDQELTHEIRFPRIVALQAPASRIPLRVLSHDLQSVNVCLTVRLDNGQALVNPENLVVSWSSTRLPASAIDGDLFANATRRCAWFRTVTFDGGEGVVTARSGLKQEQFTLVESSEYCAFLDALNEVLGESGSVLGRAGNPSPARISAAALYAMEALLRTTPEGRRLADLYRQHTFEVVSLFLAHPGLRDQAADLLRDHQAAILALLAGEGSREVLTQEMVSRLAAFWGAVKALAQPGLRDALQSEEDRLHGFRDLVDKTAGEVLALNGVTAPTAPFLHISHVAVEADHVVLDANAAGGVTPTLWRSPDLRRWSPVPGFQVLTTNSTLRLMDPAPNLSAGPGLYQIRW